MPIRIFLTEYLKYSIGIVDPKYNVMTIDIVHTYEEIDILRKPTNFYMKCELENAINNPKIIHYTTNMRIVCDRGLKILIIHLQKTLENICK